MSGRPDLSGRLAAEGLGTFCLVFAGTRSTNSLPEARDTIPAAAPAALIEHEEVLP